MTANVWRYSLLVFDYLIFEVVLLQTMVTFSWRGLLQIRVLCEIEFFESSYLYGLNGFYSQGSTDG